MFLDFNGLPGCGKTTLSLQLVRELQNEGRSVLLFQNYIDQNIQNVPSSVWFFAKGLLKTPPARWLLFIRFLFSIPHGAPRKFYRVYLLLLNYFLYRKSVKDHPETVIVSEQCVIQEIVSCYYNQIIPPEHHLIDRIIDMLGKEYCAVNAELSLKTVLDRLSERENGESRLDAVSDKASLAPILSVQDKNLAFIRNCMKGCGMKAADISMENPPNENAHLIIRFYNIGGHGT